MDPQYEQLNERLAQSLGESVSGMQREQAASDEDDTKNTQVDDLVNLAQRLQAAPQLRVDASFAETLERRFLKHALIAQQKDVQRGALWQFWRLHKAAVLMSLSLLLLLFLGLGLSTLAAQKMSPTNPLYGIKQWLQPGHATPVSTVMYETNLATQDLQATRAQLTTLLSLTTPAQTNAYVQALSQFDEQLTRTTIAIKALATGAEKTRLMSQLSLLKGETRAKLWGLLPTLTTPASVATTTELGSLGEHIPLLTNASIVVPAHPQGNATITIVGSGIQAGAQLLVDGKLVRASGALQSGHLVFVIAWKGEQHPSSLGIVNPDGTVAQTRTITVTTTSGGNGNGNQGGNNNDHGKGNT